MILEIDVGNSRVKWRLLGSSPLQCGSYARGEVPVYPAQQPREIRVSSVAGEEFERALADDLQARWGVQPWFARSTARCGQLVNSYEIPERMGVDRWLAMLAAWREIEGALCVVDAGSALTIDLVNEAGRHLGGYIIPGAAAMHASLQSGTDRVRYQAGQRASLTPGMCTASAVGNGVLLAMVASVELVLSRFAAADGEMALLCCGGDGEQLAELVSCEARYMPDLVFDGLAIAAAAEGSLSC
jgi:type III pantothenate kinase